MDVTKPYKFIWFGDILGAKPYTLGQRARKPLPKGGARSAPPVGMVFPAAGAAQTPKIGDFWSAQKPCFKNPRLNSKGFDGAFSFTDAGSGAHRQRAVIGSSPSSSKM